MALAGGSGGDSSTQRVQFRCHYGIRSQKPNSRMPLPGSQEYVKQRLLGSFLQVLDYCFIHIWGPGSHHLPKTILTIPNTEALNFLYTFAVQACVDPLGHKELHGSGFG